jgi:hypothetical protein
MKGWSGARTVVAERAGSRYITCPRTDSLVHEWALAAEVLAQPPTLFSRGGSSAVTGLVLRPRAAPPKVLLQLLPLWRRDGTGLCLCRLDATRRETGSLAVVGVGSERANGLACFIGRDVLLT